jgi:hypothetical protein
MVAPTAVLPAQVNSGTNGHAVKSKGIKSKNQLRRLKQKQKKVSQVRYFLFRINEF